MSQLSPDGRAIVPILDALLTQVRRIADALTTTPDAPSDDARTTPVRKIAHPVPAEAYTTWTEDGLAACRVMDTRTCPESYNGPCGDRPCARFESDDPAPWLDTTPAPAAPCAQHPHAPTFDGLCGGCTVYPADMRPAPAADEEQLLRWARRESLLVLLTRVQHGRTLTEDEARTLRQHVETEMREAETARTEAKRLSLTVDEYGSGARTLSEKLRKAQRAADLLAGSHRRAEQARHERDVIAADLETAEQLRAEAQATIERVRNARDSIAQLERHAVDGAADALGVVLHRLTAALDGTEQPTTEA